MGKTLDIPAAACRLRMPDNELLLQDGEVDLDGTQRKPRFKMQVNSGKPMQHWWFGQLGVNLEGITWRGKHLAALLDHDPALRIGYTTKLYIDKEQGLMAEGIMLSNETAQQVRADSKEGFPWQASCYLVAKRARWIDEGEVATLNGQDIEGPAYIFEESELREVTICALGADPNTSSDASLGDDADVIRAQLTETSSSMNDDKKQTTAAPVVDADAIRKEAALAEQKRAEHILELADSDQLELARKLISSGASAIDASLALAKDRRERAAKLSNTTTTTKATAPQAAPEPVVEQDATLSMPEGEDKWRKEFDSDAKLRAEFGRVEVYLAFQKNKHRCRDYGTSAEGTK